MSVRGTVLAWFFGMALLCTSTITAQDKQSLTIYYYLDGQTVAVERDGSLDADPQTNAATLLRALLQGPTQTEEANSLSSALPEGANLAAVRISGKEVTVDLILPSDFVMDLEPARCDAVVDQIVKTVHALGLHTVHVRAKDGLGQFSPLSSFLPSIQVPQPTPPANDDPLPNLWGDAKAVPSRTTVFTGQPPVAAQEKPQGALTGTTVWLSAGHGWYWSDVLSSWRTQRPNCYGIIEDFSNAEAVNHYLARYLWNAGADVWLVRERSMTEVEVIVDNDGGAPGYQETGVWTTSSTPGYQDGTYRWANTNSSTSATATWTPDLPQSGSYAIWAWYREGANRLIDARYEIDHAGGITVVSISQEVHGRTWRYLGEYYFSSGTQGHVTLLNQSCDVAQAVIADAMRFGGGKGSIEAPGGTSNEPRWEEAAKYWARYQGAPEEVWAGDVTARPLYAEWETAKGYPDGGKDSVYVSWHTNAGGGTGTNSFIHDTEPTTGSVELQDWIHGELVSDLRQGWDAGWVDRGQKRADFGEVRELSTMPGVLLEVAFHDTEDPGDADDLRQPLFRQIAARAVFQGIVKYVGERDIQPKTLLPEPPSHLVARSTGTGDVTLSWSPPPCCDGLVGDAATAYKVYHSGNGYGFDNGTETGETNLVLSGIAPGSLHFFRVTALNTGGESFPTAVVAVRTPALASGPKMLIVDGFERLDENALIPQWESSALGTAQRMFLERMNDYRYVIPHADALTSCDRAFDSASNEAVQADIVALGDYGAVDWFTGEDAGPTAALDATERALLATYLDNGGNLLLSGSAIGLDLVGTGQDPSFYTTYLHSAYLGSDAGTYHFAGTPGGLFAGLSGRFDDSTLGTYDVDSPDRVAAVPGAIEVLTYQDGTSDGAAVAYRGEYGLVHVGFPLETVTDKTTRSALICAASDYLLPQEWAGLSFEPEQSGAAQAGSVITYAHTLTNLGSQSDIFAIQHSSNQGWPVEHPPEITVESSLSRTLIVSITVPAGTPSGTVDITRVSAQSSHDPSVSATVSDTTTVLQPPTKQVCTPRVINPGFEGGLAQTVWVSNVTTNLVLTQRSNLPPYIAPHGGDWLAWFNPSARPAPTSTLVLTQSIALPSGEPTATLNLTWFAHPNTPSTPLTDSLTVGIYDISGTLRTSVLTATNHSPADQWHTAAFDLAPYAGEIIQLALRASTSSTHFFVDDVSITTCGETGPDEFRALWVDAYHDGIKSEAQIDELIETAQAANLNALVVQVRRRGNTFYPSALDPWAADANPDFDALAYLIERAHRAQIDVHAWVATLAIWNGTTPPQTANHAFNVHGPGTSGREYWLMTSYSGEEAAGGYLYYLDPGHPDAMDYLVDIVRELLTQYDVDGLHLDRVRFPEQKGIYCQDQVWYCQDWGYNPTSVSRFMTHYRRLTIPEPLDAEWVKWRRDQLSALVRRVYLTATAIDPHITVSIAASAVGSYPTSQASWETKTPYIHHLQDWRGWQEEGIIDLSAAMTYRDEDTQAAQFDGWLQWEKDQQYDRGTVVGPALYLNSLKDSMSQWLRIRQPSEEGNQPWGIVGYSYATTNDEQAPRRDYVNLTVRRVFTQPAAPPPLPWKETPALGHFLGIVVTPTRTGGAQEELVACYPPLDGQTITLSGPEQRMMETDGSAWFGTVDLLPGEYLLWTDELTTGVSISLPVTITAGVVTSQTVVLPWCPVEPFRIYLPLVERPAPAE